LALLTRRAVIAAGATLFAAAEWGKPGLLPTATAQDVGMRPLSDIVVAKPPAPLPPVSFTTLDGARKTLADYAGQKVVLNFWATWCIPCVAELPELDRLAAAGGFTVLAVSADRGGAAAVKPFAAAHHIDHATLLLDPQNAAVQALGVEGFPTTLLIGADGKRRGALEGPAAWGDAGATIGALMR
jgi:thiol-disulfide isomerase/thioredoxin